MGEEDVGAVRDEQVLGYLLDRQDGGSRAQVLCQLRTSCSIRGIREDAATTGLHEHCHASLDLQTSHGGSMICGLCFAQEATQPFTDQGCHMVWCQRYPSLPLVLVLPTDTDDAVSF